MVGSFFLTSVYATSAHSHQQLYLKREFYYFNLCWICRMKVPNHLPVDDQNKLFLFITWDIKYVYHRITVDITHLDKFMSPY